VAASFQTPNLFVIARDLSQMEIHTSVSEADVGAIRQEMAVQFRVDAHPDKRFDGKVRQIRLNPRSEQGVVTYNVVIDADNRERLLLPGMTARVDIVAAQRDDVLRVPNAALRFRPTEPLDGKKTDAAAKDDTRKAAEPDRTPRVYRLRDGQVAPVQVRPGISDGRASEVATVGTPADGPLAEGDRLVVRDMKARQAGDMQFSF
jgi:HlyD family secretion protein